jgi:CheY-like chemotaxis protein
MNEITANPIYVVVADLFFRSKIRVVAEAAGVTVQFARSFAELQALLSSSEKPANIIVDLNDRALRAMEFLPELAQAPQTAGLLGFVSHVDVATANAARETGCTGMTRSQFVESLPQILAGKFAG